MTNKFLTVLGFASKAGKLSFGMNASISAVLSGKSELIIISSEISEKSRKEIIFHADKKNVPVLVTEDYDILTVSNAVGRKCGIVSVNDKNFADALKSMTGGNANE